MAEGRRLPIAGTLLALLLLVAPLAGTAWYFARPKPEGPPPGPPLAELDVVCTGRVDGLHPVANLETGLPGRVAEVLVVDGQEVKKGQPLLRLDDAATRLKADEARAALAAIAVEMEAAELEKRLQPLRVAAQTAVITAAFERVAAAKRLLEQRTSQKSFGQIGQAELAAAEAEVRGLEQLETAERRRLDELKLLDPALKERAAEAKKAAADVAVRAAERAVADCVLTAPADGVVLRVQAAVGETRAPGGLTPAAVVFRPAGPLVVRAEMEQEFLGRVRPGMKAVVRDEARPDSPTWTGRVERVGEWVARRRSILLEPGEMNDVRTVECVVRVDPSPDPLLVGQRVRVRLTRGE